MRQIHLVDTFEYIKCNFKKNIVIKLFLLVFENKQFHSRWLVLNPFVVHVNDFDAAEVFEVFS